MAFLYEMMPVTGEESLFKNSLLVPVLFSVLVCEIDKSGKDALLDLSPRPGLL